MAEFDDDFRVASRSSSIILNHVEDGLDGIGDDFSCDVTGFDRAGDRSFDECARRSDLTEQPLRDGQVEPPDRTDIRAEAEPGLAIPLGIVSVQRFN